MTENKNDQQSNEVSLEEFTAARARNRLMQNAEVASEILNNVRGIVMGRFYEIEKDQPEEAKRLDAFEGKLFRKQREIDFEKPDEVEAIINEWGPLLKDKDALWRRINAR